MPRAVDLTAPIRRGAKVRATRDLRRVPKGTEGKVAMANGLTWMRYWVRFENGELLGHVDHDDIVISRAWDDYFEAKEAAAAAAVAAATDEDDSGAGGGGAAGDNPFGVPQYLLDRTSAALERLGVTR